MSTPDQLNEQSQGTLAEPQQPQVRPKGSKCFVVNGTFIVDNSTDVDNWTPFHWEWMLTWICHSQNWHELKNYIRYKPKKVKVDFYNPTASYQTAGDSDYKGINPEARLMGFTDNDYIYGPASTTCSGGYKWFSNLFVNGALRTGGYDNTGTLIKMPQVNINVSKSSILRGQNDFGTKEINCRPGESMHFEWNVNGPWRRTEEFNFVLSNPTDRTFTNELTLFPRFDYLHMKHVVPGVNSLFPTKAGGFGTGEVLKYFTWDYNGKICNQKIITETKIPDSLDNLNWVDEPNPIPVLFLKPAEMVGLSGARLIQFIQVPFTLCYEFELSDKYPEILPSVAGWNVPGFSTHANFYINRVCTLPFAHPYIPYIEGTDKKARAVFQIEELAKTVYDQA